MVAAYSWSLLLLFAFNPIGREESQASPPQARSPDRALFDTVTALADAYVARFKTAFPEISTFYVGFSDAPKDRFKDNSLPAVRRWEKFEDSLWQELTALPGGNLAGHPEEVTYAQLREMLGASRARRVCRQELWPVNSWYGWQTEWSTFAASEVVGTPEARSAVLSRWRTARHYLATEITNLQQGLQSGYVAPTATVQATLEQLDALLVTPVDSLPFMSPAQRDTSAAFEASWRAVITDSLLPAARQYRDFLRDRYLPRARPMVTSNPDGLKCYRAILRFTTGVDRDPRELFQEIQGLVSEDSLALLALADTVYPDVRPGEHRDAAWLRSRVDQDSSNVMPSVDSILAFTKAIMESARSGLSKYFMNVPETDLQLIPFPPFRQPSAPGGAYVRAAEDGSRPATYFYRTYPPVPRIGLARIVVHETWPGHHLQSVIAGNRSGHPMARLAYMPGYMEGWGQYSEWLADEMGLYPSPLDRLGRYITAAPLVVADLGMHVMGWTPERAKQYILASSPTRAPDRVAGAIALLLARPGYAASYTVGALELRRLRQQAERTLGQSFDIRRFHQIILADGQVPFTLLRSRVERWIYKETGSVGANTPLEQPGSGR